jgi:hypothetical protein
MIMYPFSFLFKSDVLVVQIKGSASVTFQRRKVAFKGCRYLVLRTTNTVDPDNLWNKPLSQVKIGQLGATLQVTEQGKRSFNTYINNAPLALRGLLP